MRFDNLPQPVADAAKARDIEADEIVRISVHPKAGVDATLGSSFRVVAKLGAASVAATPLMRDRVDAVVTGGDSLTLELRSNGSVPYSLIRAFN